MKWPVLASLAVIAMLPGCFGGGTTYHIQGIQCEPMPWDGDEYGGTDAERLARLRGHYEAAGYEVVDASVYAYDVMVTAVCGAWDTKVYEIAIAGPFDDAESDGWTKGSAPKENRL